MDEYLRRYLVKYPEITDVKISTNGLLQRKSNERVKEFSREDFTNNLFVPYGKEKREDLSDRRYEKKEYDDIDFTGEQEKPL